MGDSRDTNQLNDAVEPTPGHTSHHPCAEDAEPRVTASLQDPGEQKDSSLQEDTKCGNDMDSKGYEIGDTCNLTKEQDLDTVTSCNGGNWTDSDFSSEDQPTPVLIPTSVMYSQSPELAHTVPAKVAKQDSFRDVHFCKPLIVDLQEETVSPKQSRPPHVNKKIPPHMNDHRIKKVTTPRSHRRYSKKRISGNPQ